MNWSPIEDDARKFLGAHPYLGFSNIVAGDGYFDASCRSKHGEAAWAAACKDVALRRNEIAAEAMDAAPMNEAAAAARANAMASAPDALASAVAELRKSRAMQKGAWLLVTEAARKYAQMKTHGTYIERGNVVSVSFSSRGSMTEHFEQELLQAVLRAYAEDAMMGAALADLT